MKCIGLSTDIFCVLFQIYPCKYESCIYVWLLSTYGLGGVYLLPKITVPVLMIFSYTPHGWCEGCVSRRVVIVAHSCQPHTWYATAPSAWPPDHLTLFLIIYYYPYPNPNPSSQHSINCSIFESYAGSICWFHSTTHDTYLKRWGARLPPTTHAPNWSYS